MEYNSNKIYKGQTFTCYLSISILSECHDLQISEAFYKQFSMLLLKIQCKN